MAKRGHRGVGVGYVESYMLSYVITYTLGYIKPITYRRAFLPKINFSVYNFINLATSYLGINPVRCYRGYISEIFLSPLLSLRLVYLFRCPSW